MAKTIASQDLKIRDLKNKLQAKEHELIMMKAENFAFKGLVKTQDNLIEDLQNKNDSIQNIADDLQRRNHDLTQMLETKEKALDEIEEIAKIDCENCCECTTEFNLQESCSIYEILDIRAKAKEQ